ncbi:hypothetical protein A8B84_12945 [Marinobacter sp. EhC06]|uniref:hypothetical protein n=1 Tax=Marinobacter TaxID=2742 RepID=UPI0007D923BF|nr:MULTISPECIES: hypothetical protein [unclassified Marinobacter]OAN89177.1 hypothetical protein A8B84_12945 [Marinobacter sp. EhC06]OAN95827.1 hypothetical protein A8B80_12180 [Marinobacter sp. EhN04]
MTDAISLPASSLGELEKIIKGYGHSGKEIDLASLSKLIGIGRTSISPNNPFLAETGIVTSGKKKKITDEGLKLARALDHNQSEHIAATWRKVVRESEFLSNIVSTIRIKGGLSVEDAAGHVLYAAGAKNTKGNRTGARTIVDILVITGLVSNDDGTLRVAQTNPDDSEPVAKEALDHGGGQQSDRSSSFNVDPVSTAQNEAPISGIGGLSSQIKGNGVPTIAINIELHLPATDNPEVYDQLFKSLRKNLLSPEDDD